MGLSWWLRQYVGDTSLIPGLGRSPGVRNGYYSSTLAWKIPWAHEPDRLELDTPRTHGRLGPFRFWWQRHTPHRTTVWGPEERVSAKQLAEGPGGPTAAVFPPALRSLSLSPLSPSLSLFLHLSVSDSLFCRLSPRGYKHTHLLCSPHPVQRLLSTPLLFCPAPCFCLSCPTPVPLRIEEYQRKGGIETKQDPRGRESLDIKACLCPCH